MTDDTIIALSTPPGVAALALVRLSGPGCREMAASLLQGPGPIQWQSHQAVHHYLYDNGMLLDDVVITFFQAPNSYTGQDTLEIACHGSPLIVQKIIQAFLARGARLAGPGEFTQRAFLNGKMDLTQAEAVQDLIAASSERALLGAQAMKEGRLGAHLQHIRAELIDLLAHLEAYIDFPEEDIAPQVGSEFSLRVDKLIGQISRLIATAPMGKILREGVLTAIVGAPNVGKSSLLNALLRDNRAIVSAIPGTTRDSIEADCNIRGWHLRLVDTAGQRQTQDEIEAEGVRRAQEITRKAQLVLHVVEAHRSCGASGADADGVAASEFFNPKILAPHQHYIKVANKIDLGCDHSNKDAVGVSTKTGEGLDRLEAAIEQQLMTAPAAESEGWLTVNARQENALRRAKDALDRAAASIRKPEPPELISVDLRDALGEIGSVVGLASNEDVLDQLFKNFCIGK
jgi:tRNA modification GTPase